MMANMHRPLLSALIVAAILSINASFSALKAADEPTRVLIVVGPSTHPPGSHEVAAGGRLVKQCLEHADKVKDVEADVFYEWPQDAAARDRAATIVFLGDTFPPARLPDSAKVMSELGAMMNRGCGLVCIHYATGLRAEDVAEDGDHPLLRWMGGYFATKCKHHQSVARMMTATITPGDARHPVSRGWHEFTLNDEPYYNNYFGRGGPAPGVTVLATSMLPPEDPKREVVAWAVDRSDGGRGIGVVMPHTYRNWTCDDLRKLILNGIVWTAHREVPSEGVQTASPDLAMFEPAALDPKPREPAKKK